jgi:HEPN domain-containing protein
LKGLLLHLSIAFPRTHAIELLLDLLKNAGSEIPPRIDEAFILTQYAVETRYPGSIEPVERNEAKRALILSAEVLRWVEEKL